MEQVILLLYVKDAVYGKRFLRFLMGKHHPRLHLELVTDRENMENRLGTDRQSLVVLTDDRTVRADEKKRRNVIYLSKEKWATGDSIFQYQKAEVIYKELLEKLRFDAIEEEPDGAAQMPGVYVVFSPTGSSATLFSVMLSQYLGQYGASLYVSLSGFPIFFDGQIRQKPEYGGRGLGELLFFLQDKEFPQRQEEVRKPFGNGFMIVPAPHFKDILDATAQEWKKLFSRLSKECGYRYIVVEIGQILDDLFDIMEGGDRIFLVTAPGCFEKVRQELFWRYCQMEKKEGLKKEIESVELPFVAEEWEQLLTNQPLGEISKNPQNMEFIHQLLTGERREERDVCIMEEDG